MVGIPFTKWSSRQGWNPHLLHQQVDSLPLSHLGSPLHIYSMFAFPLGEGNGTPLQYSCLEDPMDGGAW